MVRTVSGQAVMGHTVVGPTFGPGFVFAKSSVVYDSLWPHEL